MKKIKISWFFLLICVLHVLVALGQDQMGAGENSVISRLSIVLGEHANTMEKKVAQLLKDRILEKSDMEISIDSITVTAQPGELTIFLGRPDHHSGLLDSFHENRIPMLTELAPGPEGFLLYRAHQGPILVAGKDDRGCLYAVGELLRRISFRAEVISIPDELNIRTAPAFEIRGTQFGQSGVAKRMARVRDWTEEETRRVILDYALAGANIFSVDKGEMFDFIKSYGLMTQGGFGANTAPEIKRADWAASESIGRTGYVCPSVPEARAYMLRKCEDFAKTSPDFDLIKFHGGDGGGCECDRCDPYGLTFIRLVEDMANIIHQYHPDTRIYFTNQKFDNADDSAIFNYLQEQPRDWLWAWGYGPGSDATTWQPGHRQTHRMDLFRYPGFGPYSLYPKEIISQIPPRHKLVYYNEITHWKYAQHAYIQMYPRADKNGDLPPHWSHDIYERRPDQYLTMVYNRLTFYAWPRNYHQVFNDLMRYGIGDITHSSGHHDHFNQWMWQRLLWAPRTSVEEVVNEYCRAWFGEESAPLLAGAIFQLEENLEEIPDKPLPEKEGIRKYYQMVRQAGEVMPDVWMKDNWLWRMYMQKGALDLYIQLAVVEQMRLRDTVQQLVAESLENDVSIQLLHDAFSLLETGMKETAEMVKLRKETTQWGEESNQMFGVRNDGLYNLSHDFIGLGWYKRQIYRAVKAVSRERRDLLQMVVNYEDPGDGGFYDNLGTFNMAPNIVAGYPYDHGQPYVQEMLAEDNLPSQRSMHFTQDEKQGVTLHYTNLDTEGRYKVRLTLVRPWYQERYASRMNQHTESIYADEEILVKDLELPERMSDFFTFDIPQRVTKDGELEIRLEKSPEVADGDRVSTEQWRNSGGWGTIVSEVWLMKE